MAPIKFEEDLKDRLEKRSIAPSKKAWNTLSDRLDAEEKKENKKGFWWLAIAATVIGVFLLAYPHFNSNSIDVVTPAVVEQNENTTIKAEQKMTIPNSMDQKGTKDKVVTTNVEKTEGKTAGNLIQENQKQVVTSSVNNKDKSALANTSLDNIRVNEEILFQMYGLDENEVGLTSTVQQETTANTDSAIDSLLSKARQEIAMGTSKNKVVIPIDHNALLQDVEDDLEESFRDKLLKKVRKGYSSIREELAERND